MNTPLRQVHPSEFYIDETVSETGPVARWNSNNNIPPLEYLQQMKELGYIDFLTWENSIEQYHIEKEETIKRYIEAQRNHVPDVEELAEMRSVFGVGTKVVNVITGQSIEL